MNYAEFRLKHSDPVAEPTRRICRIHGCFIVIQKISVLFFRILLTDFKFIKHRKENMAGVVFEDIFDVKDIDPGGKKFDRGI